MTENLQPSSQQASQATQSIEQDDEISLLDLLQVVVDNLRLLVLGPLAVGVLALAVSFLVTPTFTAKTVFLPPQQQQSAAASMFASLGSLGGLAGAAAGLKSPADQYLAYLKSVSLQDALVDRLGLMERYKTQFKVDARARLNAVVRASSGKDGLIVLEADDEDPKFAADLANAHVEELRKLLGTLAVTEAQQRRLFFEKQLKLAKDSLTQADLALRAAGVSESVLKSNPASAVAAVAGLRAQLTAQEVKLGAMRGYLAETAPEFKLALNELANLRAQIAKQGEDSPTSEITPTAPTGPNSKAGHPNTPQDDYVSKYREYKYQEALFELFTKQFEIARVDEAREGAVVQVLDVATPPEKKAKPQKALVAIIATLAMGFVLLLYVFIKNALKGSEQDEEMRAKVAALKVSWKRVLGIS
jgi:uncharacterized protein involved in exopolysaccharide biosynthesis